MGIIRRGSILPLCSTTDTVHARRALADDFDVETLHAGTVLFRVGLFAGMESIGADNAVNEANGLGTNHLGVPLE